MSKEEFTTVIRQMPLKLPSHGYQIQLREEAFYAVEFWKKPLKGVFCLIGFDLFRTSGIHNECKIYLIKRGLQDYTGKDLYYKPFALGFRSLMLGLYNGDIFPRVILHRNFRMRKFSRPS